LNGFFPRACHVAAAWEEGKIERAIGYLRRNFLPLRTFTDLADVNRQVRQAALGSLALHSVANSQWAREYYEQQRAKGKRRNTVIRSLAFKCIRISVPLLERTPAVRRGGLSKRIGGPSPQRTAHRSTCGTAVEKCCWL
jgi:hypothetical protein